MHFKLCHKPFHKSNIHKRTPRNKCGPIINATLTECKSMIKSQMNILYNTRIHQLESKSSQKKEDMPCRRDHSGKPGLEDSARST